MYFVHLRGGQAAIKSFVLIRVELNAGGKSTSNQTGQILPMKRTAAVLFVLCVGVATAARAQVVESATVRTFRINVGGMGSAFVPNEGKNAPYGPHADYLVGVGTYVDFHFTHWVQIEGEARWLRLNEYAGEHQDHYLIGPRVPIHERGKMDFYGKALIGFANMTFPNKYGYGTFTALAFGGGMDYKLSSKLTLRAVDFEYQVWPKFLPDASIKPYGASVGMAYRVF